MAVQSTLRHSEDPLAQLFAHYAKLIRQRIRTTSRTTRLVATILLLSTIIASSIGGRRWWARRHAEKEQGQRLLRRNSGLKGKDGSRTIFVPYKSSTSKVVIHPTKMTTFEAHRRLFLNPPRVSGMTDLSAVPRIPPLQTKPGLNLAFLHQFLSLLSIMIPRWQSKETALLLSHGVFLALRTYLSLVVARLDGEIVRDLVAGQGKGFTWGIVKWCGIGAVASYTNSMLKYLQSKVAIGFRTRLTRYIHDLYLSPNLSYYKLTNLDGGVGNDFDQLLTQDLTLFCSAAASLYSSLLKPTADIFLFSYQLYKSLGPLASAGLWSNYILTAILLRKLSPPFGKMRAVEGRREGEFRGLHARLIANAEEVAFYGGADMEKVFLDKGWAHLKKWMESIYTLKIRYNILEDFILKYSWSAYGYLLTSLPVFLPTWGGMGGALELSSEYSGKERGRMKEFITNKRLMLSLADAGGRLMYSLKDLSELAGYTSRVYTLISTLHRVDANAYFAPQGTHPELYSLSDVQGTVQKGFDGVRLENVPIVAPSIFPNGGDELIMSLSMIVHSGEHLLISGPNGVGKSAIARILANLWPTYRGLVSRPRSTSTDGIMFLPQRPYLSSGTLRDQIIYPDTEPDLLARGLRDRNLLKVLEMARLEYLPDREGGYDTRKEWKDVLSGGEKQRMGFARVVYHEPRYVVIDEGSSAVSSDVEGWLYEMLKERGITLITISTRASLKKYHSYVLTLGVEDEDEDVNGEESRVGSIKGYGWKWERIGSERQKIGVARELADLKERLAKVVRWKSRLEEIKVELGRVLGEGVDVKLEADGKDEMKNEEVEDKKGMIRRLKEAEAEVKS